MRILLQKWALFTVCGGHWASGEKCLRHELSIEHGPLATRTCVNSEQITTPNSESQPCHMIIGHFCHYRRGPEQDAIETNGL